MIITPTKARVMMASEMSTPRTEATYLRRSVFAVKQSTESTMKRMPLRVSAGDETRATGIGGAVGVDIAVFIESAHPVLESGKAVLESALAVLESAHPVIESGTAGATCVAV